MRRRDFMRLKSGDRVLWKPDGRRGSVEWNRGRDDPPYMAGKPKISFVCVVWDDREISHLDDVSDYLFLVKEGSG